MKKSVFFAFGFLVGSLVFTTPAVKAAFSDVPADSLYGPSILHLQDRGIVEGFSDGTYRPVATITRAEYTKILLLSKFENAQALSCDDPSFSDVEKGTWYYPYVCYAKANNIVAGYSDGAFRPNQPISYAEGAKILVNVLIATTADAAPPEWWTPYTTILKAQGVEPPTVSSANASLTRGEMAFMASGVIRNTVASFIKERFDGKLVYVTNPGTSVDELKAHCAVEGGAFNECGSPCAPDAEICADVCTYTCTLPTADTENLTAFILKRFDSKLVYDQKTGVTEEQLKQHCATEGGLYNSCGNSCAPDATECDTACVATCEDVPQSGKGTKEETTIEQTYPNKLVYTTNTSESAEKYQNDCSARGGEFNECGNTCAPNAEICTTVCAYTCSGFEDKGVNDVSKDYENVTLGFRLQHPAEAIVDEKPESTGGGYVDIRLAGATQPATGALTDGILLRISRADLGTDTLPAFVDARVADEKANTPITLPKERYAIGEKEGFRFGSGNGNFAFLPADANSLFILATMVKDPEAKGYQAILDKMLDSLEFFDTASFEFKTGKIVLHYPKNLLTAGSEADSLTLTHGVPYKHADVCDFQGTGKELTTLTDFNTNYTASAADLKTVVAAHESADFVAADMTTDGTGLKLQDGVIDAVVASGHSGFRVMMGVEGCGEYHYYFPIRDSLTLFIKRNFVPEFSDVSANKDKALQVEGVILPEQAEAIFDSILKSVEIPAE